MRKGAKDKDAEEALASNCFLLALAEVAILSFGTGSERRGDSPALTKREGRGDKNVSSTDGTFSWRDATDFEMASSLALYKSFCSCNLIMEETVMKQDLLFCENLIMRKFAYYLLA